MAVYIYTHSLSGCAARWTRCGGASGTASPPTRRPDATTMTCGRCAAPRSVSSMTAGAGVLTRAATTATRSSYGSTPARRSPPSTPPSMGLPCTGSTRSGVAPRRAPTMAQPRASTCPSTSACARTGYDSALRRTSCKAVATAPRVRSWAHPASGLASSPAARCATQQWHRWQHRELT